MLKPRVVTQRSKRGLAALDWTGAVAATGAGARAGTGAVVVSD